MHITQLIEQLKAMPEKMEGFNSDREYCYDLVRSLQKEIAQLNSRLEAVVKECEKEKSKWVPAMEYESVVRRSSIVDRYDRILRIARGDVWKEV